MIELLLGAAIVLSLAGDKNGSVTQSGVTAELQWEKPDVQRLTVRGNSSEAVIVKIFPRLVPMRIFFKAKPVVRTVGAWTGGDAPQWRTVGDVLHLEVYVPAVTTAGTATFSLFGRSSPDDVTRAQGLIDFVKRVQPWLSSDQIPTSVRNLVGGIAMRHAVKIDGNEPSDKVATALREDILKAMPEIAAYQGLQTEILGARAIATLGKDGGVAVSAFAGWPFRETKLLGVDWEDAPLQIAGAKLSLREAGVAPVGRVKLTGRARLDIEGQKLTVPVTLDVDTPSLLLWSIPEQTTWRYEGSQPGMISIKSKGAVTAALWSDEPQALYLYVTCQDSAPGLWVQERPMALAAFGPNVYRTRITLGKGWSDIRLTVPGSFGVLLVSPSDSPITGVRNACTRPKN